MKIFKALRKARIALVLLAIIIGCKSYEKTPAKPLSFQSKQLPEDLSFKSLFDPKKEYHYFENADDYPFHFKSNTFELVNAWWLAEASMLVYVRDENFVRTQLFNAGFNEVKFFRNDETGTQAFVAQNEEYIIVSFRGTEVTETEDIFTDIKFIPVKFDDRGKVHMGFKDAVGNVWEEMKKYLEKIRSKSDNKQTVWFTGHSLGAALATLAADLYDEVYPVQGLYTFGSPRVGDNEFADKYRVEQAYRFANNNDIVAMVPPAGLFCHVGIFKYIDCKGKINENPEASYTFADQAKGHADHTKKVIARLKAGANDSIPSDNLNDHAPIYYVVKIWNFLPNHRK